MPNIRNVREVYNMGRFKALKRPDLSHIETPPGSRAVPLTKGKYALVDEEDYERVMQCNWSLSGDLRYTSARIKGCLILMHRFIINPPKDMVLYHINGDGLDNRKCNLRVCTQRQNSYNCIGSKNVSSKFKGVSWHKLTSKWRATIMKDRKQIYLGLFTDEREAAKAYNKKAYELFNSFSKLNDIE